jgi:hypothetical protein
MPNNEELIQALTQLDPATLEEVVNTAYRRLGTIDAEPHPSPDPHATPEQFAQWLARRHLSTDAAIDRVVYLPAGAPENEIRLLEVNRFLNPPDPQSIEPLDFTPDDLSYRVFVADITSDQWDRVQREGDAVLPAGWQLAGNRVIGRG